MTQAVSPQMTQTIQSDLAAIAQEEGVHVLLAIESGSRAWGFHSPDSDYDVRFIYAEPVDWHLSLGKKRDVIERPIDAELDISGWSLAKTLGLMMNGNAVTAEWLQSPIVYGEAEGARADLLAFAQAALTRRPVTWHYSRLLFNQMSRCYDAEGQLRLKKFFYALRPALALRWIRLKDNPVPPMDMAALRSGSNLDQAIETQIDTLLEEKRTAREKATSNSAYPLLEALIRDELAQADAWLAGPADAPGKRDLMAQANAIHRRYCRMAGA